MERPWYSWSRGDDWPRNVRELERRLLERMERHAGNVSIVARDMGKARAQIRRWFKRFRIDAERFR